MQTRTPLAAFALVAGLALAAPAQAQGLSDIGNSCKGLGWGALLGAAGGGAAGGFLGNKIGGTAGAVLGTLGGGVGGYFVGRMFDSDCKQAAVTQQQAFETAPAGKQVAWNNPQTGNRGTITPAAYYTDPNTGQTCRNYKQTIRVDGKSQNQSGTACKQADGTWRIRE